MVASDWPRKDAAMMRSAAYCSSVKDLLILEILAIPISVSTSIAFATLSRKTQQKVFQGGIAGNRCDVSCPKACGPDAGGKRLPVAVNFISPSAKPTADLRYDDGELVGFGHGAAT
jgi:hypothetical protein